MQAFARQLDRSPSLQAWSSVVAKLLTLLIGLAALMGACGVILAALSVHVAAGTGLDSAAYMLLFHAVAILSSGVIAQQGLLARPLTVSAMGAWAVGAALFAGDIAMRAFAGHRLFPMAAPTGGTLLIAGWLILAAAAAVGLARRG
jgi:uncharacterized membrane protein YgdD (TMEM256/DUF423 family)